MLIYKFRTNGTIYCVVSGCDVLVRVREDEGEYKFDFSIMDVNSLGYNFVEYIPDGKLLEFISDHMVVLYLSTSNWNRGSLIYSVSFSGAFLGSISMYEMYEFLFNISISLMARLCDRNVS
jgi:hypothetical protein